MNLTHSGGRKKNVDGIDLSVRPLHCLQGSPTAAYPKLIACEPNTQRR